MFQPNLITNWVEAFFRGFIHGQVPRNFVFRTYAKKVAGTVPVPFAQKREKMIRYALNGTTERAYCFESRASQGYFENVRVSPSFAILALFCYYEVQSFVSV